MKLLLKNLVFFMNLSSHEWQMSTFLAGHVNFSKRRIFSSRQ